MEVIYTGAKLRSQFNIKDRIPKRHNYDTMTPFAQRAIAMELHFDNNYCSQLAS